MLFITNRFPTQSIRTRKGRRFTFDLSNNAPSNSVFFCERIAAEEHEEIGGLALLQRLKDAEYRQVIVYIHGFSNLPEDVFAEAQELQKLCDDAKAKEAIVLPIIWPCDDDRGIVQDYWDDQKAADMSAASIARVLDIFVQWRNSEQANPVDAPCLKRVNILAHSMGNRVLRAALAHWRRYDMPGGLPLLFRNTFLVAADIVNESLEFGHEGEHICNASRNVAVYYASDDLALRASKAANLRARIASRRLGHTGPEDIDATPKNVYSLDCDDLNTRYDYPKGHTYFRSAEDGVRPGVVFNRIFNAILTGRIFPGNEFRRQAILKDDFTPS